MANENTRLVSAVNTRMVFDDSEPLEYLVGMANRLRHFREQAKLTQKELAQKIGTQQSQINRWEKESNDDDYRRIPLKWARKAAKALNCLLSDLRPDILSDESLDLLLEGASPDLIKDVREYAIFKLGQRR